MKTSISISDFETQVLLAPDNETDKTAISLLSVVNGASIVRRTFNVENTSVKKYCLLIRIEEAKREATLFEEGTDVIQ